MLSTQLSNEWRRKICCAQFRESLKMRERSLKSLTKCSARRRRRNRLKLKIDIHLMDFAVTKDQQQYFRIFIRLTSLRRKGNHNIVVRLDWISLLEFCDDWISAGENLKRWFRLKLQALWLHAFLILCGGEMTFLLVMSCDLRLGAVKLFGKIWLDVFYWQTERADFW